MGERFPMPDKRIRTKGKRHIFNGICESGNQKKMNKYQMPYRTDEKKTRSGGYGFQGLNLCLTCFFIGLLAIPVGSAPAKGYEIGKICIPEKLELDDYQLVLNGAGLRKKYLMQIYAGALYLPHKMTNPREIINAKKPMVMRIQILSEHLTGDIMAESFVRGVKEVTAGNIEPYRDIIDAVVKFYKDVRKGDVFEIAYSPKSGLSIARNGVRLGCVDRFDFKKVVFALWLGKNPANPGLKQALLGIQ